MNLRLSLPWYKHISAESTSLQVGKSESKEIKKISRWNQRLIKLLGEKTILDQLVDIIKKICMITYNKIVAKEPIQIEHTPIFDTEETPSQSLTTRPHTPRKVDSPQRTNNTSNVNSNTTNVKPPISPKVASLQVQATEIQVPQSNNEATPNTNSNSSQNIAGSVIQPESSSEPVNLPESITESPQPSTSPKEDPENQALLNETPIPETPDSLAEGTNPISQETPLILTTILIQTETITVATPQPNSKVITPPNSPTVAPKDALKTNIPEANQNTEPSIVVDLTVSDNSAKDSESQPETPSTSITPPELPPQVVQSTLTPPGSPVSETIDNGNANPPSPVHLDLDGDATTHDSSSTPTMVEIVTDTIATNILQPDLVLATTPSILATTPAAVVIVAVEELKPNNDSEALDEFNLPQPDENREDILPGPLAATEPPQLDFTPQQTPEDTTPPVVVEPTSPGKENVAEPASTATPILARLQIEDPSLNTIKSSDGSETSNTASDEGQPVVNEINADSASQSQQVIPDSEGSQVTSSTSTTSQRQDTPAITSNIKTARFPESDSKLTTTRSVRRDGRKLTRREQAQLRANVTNSIFGSTPKKKH